MRTSKTGGFGEVRWGACGAPPPPILFRPYLKNLFQIENHGYFTRTKHTVVDLPSALHMFGCNLSRTDTLLGNVDAAEQHAGL